MRRPLALIALATVVWLWVGAVLAAPVSATHSHEGVRSLTASVYLTGSLICHQRTERSFHLAGVKLPVCARCTGLYVGGALGVMAWAFVRGLRQHPSSLAAALSRPAFPRMLLLIVAVPTAISVVTGLAGVWSPDNVTRAILAVPLGCGIGAVVGAVVTRDLR